MLTDFNCACGKKFRVDAQYGGKKAKCPLCGAMFAIPFNNQISQRHAPAQTTIPLPEFSGHAFKFALGAVSVLAILLVVGIGILMLPSGVIASRDPILDNSTTRSEAIQTPVEPADKLEEANASLLSPALSDRERLLKENVALVIVLAHYSGTMEGHAVELDGVWGWGTAFAVYTDGLLATNKHVVEAANSNGIPANYPGTDLSFVRCSYLVCFGPNASEQLPATLVKESNGLDLAFLRIHRSFPRHFILSEKTSHQGDEVFACGYPGVVGQVLNNGYQPSSQQIDDLKQKIVQTGHLSDLDGFNPDFFNSTLTHGIVSSEERNINGSNYLQFDAKIAHGNSGGPLLDADGQVLGVVTLTLGLFSEGEGYGFAIPAQDLRNEMQLLPNRN